MRLGAVLLVMTSFLLPAASSPAQDIGAGEELFKRKCKACHRLTEGMKVGPSLKGVTARRSDEWLDQWLKDPEAMIKNGDSVALELLEKYKKKMPKLKSMQDEKNRRDVIAFLKSVNND
ncbi:MAG: c-type cytochrome [Candidatus Nitrospinota bacterium M3_3B_026]